MGKYVRGKYNTGRSLDISDFSETELRAAIKDWSQGYESMEKFLWECYYVGLKTFGTNMGNLTYVDFDIENSNKTMLKRLLAASLTNKNLYLSFSNGINNPVSSKSMNRYRIEIAKKYCKNCEESNQFINDLTDSMKKQDELPEYELIDDILELAIFFKEKKSDIRSFSIETNEDLAYSFEIVPSIYLMKSGKLDDFFSSLGMENRFREERPVDGWRIDTINMEDLIGKVKRIKEGIIKSQNEYFELPGEVEEEMNFYTVYKIKELEFGDTPEGKEKLEEWLHKARRLWGNFEDKDWLTNFKKWLYQKEGKSILEQSVIDMSSYDGITSSQIANAGIEINREGKDGVSEKDKESK